MEVRASGMVGKSRASRRWLAERLSALPAHRRNRMLGAAQPIAGQSGPVWRTCEGRGPPFRPSGLRVPCLGRGARHGACGCAVAAQAACARTRGPGGCRRAKGVRHSRRAHARPRGRSAAGDIEWLERNSHAVRNALGAPRLETVIRRCRSVRLGHALRVVREKLRARLQALATMPDTWCVAARGELLVALTTRPQWRVLGPASNT